MANSFFNVEIEQFGKAVETRAFSSVEGILQCCRDFEDEHDVTLVVYPLSSRERLLLGFDQGFAFVALETPAGLYQFKPNERTKGAPESSQLGSQETHLVSDYLLPASFSAEVVERWIAGNHESLDFGSWERK